MLYYAPRLIPGPRHFALHRSHFSRLPTCSCHYCDDAQECTREELAFFCATMALRVALSGLSHSSWLNSGWRAGLCRRGSRDRRGSSRDRRGSSRDRRGSRGPKPVFCRRPFRPIARHFEGFILDCANRTVRRAAIVGGNLEEFCTVRWRHRARLSTNFSLGGGGGGARIQCERRPRGGSKPVHAVAERRHKPRHDALISGVCDPC